MRFILREKEVILCLCNVISGQVNESSKAYTLPFRVHAFIDYQDDFQNFIVMYVYQFPLMFIAFMPYKSVC